MAATGRAFEPPPLNRRTAFISWRWLAISSLAIAVIAIALLLALRSRESDAQRGTRALIAAFSERRLIEPRLSGGFKAGEFRPVAKDEPGLTTSELNRARTLIEDSVTEGGIPAQLAYARLLLSHNEKLPEAMKFLRSILAITPENAEAHNDLGVCMIQQGKLEDAITEFDAALENKADMPEALFNRALCYQRLLLRDAARNEFTRLALIEREEGWLKEVRQRLVDVSSLTPESGSVANFQTAINGGRTEEATRLVEEDPEVMMRHALRQASYDYLQASGNGDRESSERAMREVEFIGSVLRDKRSDTMVAECASYLRGLTSEQQSSQLELINRYREAVGAFETNRLDPGRIAGLNREFERSEESFRNSGNHVFAALSAFQGTNYYYADKRFKASLELLTRSLLSVEGRQWPYYQSRLLNLLALVTSRLGQDSLAIKYFEQAIMLCSGVPGLEAQILQYMSVPYSHLGDIETALLRLRDSTRLFLENRLSARYFDNLAYNYLQLATSYSQQNQPALTLLYATQALAYSEQTKDPAYAAQASAFLALQNARLNRFEESEAYLSRALDYLRSTGALNVRNYTGAFVLTHAGEVAALRRDIPRALGYYEQAETLTKHDEEGTLQAISVLRRRAQAFTESGKNDLARSDLMRVVNLIEKYRAKIATSEHRSKFLDMSHDVFDQLISLDNDALGRAEESFEISERARARALLDDILHGHKDVTPLRLDGVRSQLPADLAVLQYSVTSEATYLFVITRTGFRMSRSTATTEIIEPLIRDYIADLRNPKSNEKELNEKASTLYRHLILPVEDQIKQERNLCIVPDKTLHALPFSALIDGAGKYLIQSHQLSYAPSASVLAECLRQRKLKSARSVERVITVGNPRFDGNQFKNLQPLQLAEREAVESARIYQNAVALVGSEATEPAIRAAIGDCDVAHLALHCLIEESSPWLAALVLAAPTQGGSGGFAQSGAAQSSLPNSSVRSAALTNALPQAPRIDPNDGLLYLNELYDIKLPRTGLVVLSACQSGLGQYYRGEGIVSLVRPLLAAGVPTVVASLWAVDESATSDLMIEFHHQRKPAGMRTALALQTAQNKIRQDSRYQHPYYWAPFIVVGAHN